MLLLTADEMRALDRATIDGGVVSGPELMERAGRAVALAAQKHFGSPLALHVLVLCGPGNNGGDGFAAARCLHELGARVAVGVVVPREKVSGDARHHLERMEAAGLHAEFLSSDVALANLATTRHGWDWAIDALLGTGAAGPPHGLVGAAVETLRLLHARGARVIAADLPTGVSSDDGDVAGSAVQAHLTVTFGHPRRGHFLHPGRGHCGALEVADIGLVPATDAGVEGVALAEPAAFAPLVPARDPRAHKGTAGRVLVVGGAMGMAGAVILAARAASRGGAGYVRVAAPASLVDVLASQLVEQMPVPCGEGPSRALSSSAAAQVLEEAVRADAVALGPGLSRAGDALALVRDLVARIDRPLVVDADALAAFSPPAGDLAAALAGAPAPRIVTPHLGEMARLTGQLPSAIEARRVDVAREWARRWRCVLVLKGAPTIVAAPDGRACLNPTGNPGMATAGMGDVLTGAIAALLAQHLSPYDAACVAVLAHGAAGDLAAAEIAPVGLVAGDVAERLPRALRWIASAGRDGA